PSCAELRIIRGLVFLEQQKWSDALADFDRAFALDPNIIEALMNRSKAKQAMGDDAGALDDIDEVLSLDSGWAEAYHNRGMRKTKMKTPAAAIVDFDKAIGLKKGLYQTFYLRAMAHEETGNLGAAVKDLEETLRLSPPAWPFRGVAENALRRDRAALRSKE